MHWSWEEVSERKTEDFVSPVCEELPLTVLFHFKLKDVGPVLENHLNYSSWDQVKKLSWSCPFIMTVWSSLREVSQAVLFQLFNVNEQ